MKRVLAIFKDLQDSGQQAAIVGYFSIQLGQFQKVTESNDVRVLPNITPSSTDESKKPNRYTTEHDRDDADVDCPASSVVLLPELLEVIDIWPNLPDSVRAGIIAMVKAVSPGARQEQQPSGQ